MLDRMNLLFRLAAIAEAGSLRQAAVTLNITQPALSRSLAHLEAVYGQPLLERHARGVTPTPFGQRLLTSVNRLARDWALSERALMQQTREIEGVLRVSAGPLWDSLILPAVIGPLQQRFPRLGVELRYETGEQLYSALLDGRMDVGFGGLPQLDRGHDILATREFGRVRDRLVARAEHPIHRCAPNDYGALVGLPWVIFTTDPIYEQQIVHTVVERTGVTPDIRVRCGSLLALVRLMENADYLTMLPTTASGQSIRATLRPAPIDLGRRSGPTGARFRRSMADYPPLTALFELCQTMFET